MSLLLVAVTVAATLIAGFLIGAWLVDQIAAAMP